MADNVIKQQTKKEGAFEKRVHEVDFVRGLLILLVLFDHLMNAFGLHSATWYNDTGIQTFLNIKNAMDWYWTFWGRSLIRIIALLSFCFISGLSCAFSRNNWKRAGEMLVLWALLFVGGRILNEAQFIPGLVTRIDFNVIGVLAWSTLFYCFIQNQSWKGKLASTLIWALISSVGLYALNGIPNIQNVYCPPIFNPEILGIRQADWMPLIPYIVAFFLGATLTSIIYKDKTPKFKRHEFERPVCYIGRHTLWIYLGHQAVIIPVFMLADVIVRAMHGK